MPRQSLPLGALLIAALTCAAPAMARPGWGGGWGGGWGNGWDQPYPTDINRDNAPANGPDSREGQVFDVARFMAKGAENVLGHGPISVVAAPDANADAGADANTDANTDAGANADNSEAARPLPDALGPPPLAPANGATFQAAVVDRLVKAGYDTLKPDTQGGQIAEVRVRRTVIIPAQPKPKPVHGSAEMGISNYGTMMGLGISVDLTKPKPALIATRLDVRIRARDSNAPLWEGHATIYSYDGSDQWTQQAVATTLADALFRQFPDAAHDIMVDQ